MDDNFAQAVEALLQTEGKVIVTGVGKSAHIAAKIAATLNSTGTSAMFMHAGEAMHGDVGAVNEGDAVLCLSKSGSSDEVVALLPILKQRNCSPCGHDGEAFFSIGSSRRRSAGCRRVRGGVSI